MILSSPESYNLLHEGTLALSKIEEAGIRIDLDYLDRTTKDVTATIKRLEGEIKESEVFRVWRRTFGTKTNLGSRPQLANVLFTQMGLKPSAQTGTGKIQVDKSALDKVEVLLAGMGDDVPFIKPFLKMENLKKTLGTYLVGIRREVIQHADGLWYIHPITNLNTAATYRSSYQMPNFQNIPKRDEEMAKFVRKCYMPHPGHHMVEIDFSTLEVRIAYTYHKDPVMRKYLIDPTTDMHRDQAAEIFCLPQKLLTDNAKEAKKTVRDSAKNQFVFPQFYGDVYFSIAPQIWQSIVRKAWTVPGSSETILEHLAKKGIKKLGACDPKEKPKPGTFEKHIQECEKKLWDRFKIYAQWKRDWFMQYQKRGYFKMHTGFVVNTQHARNDVINYPVQGAAFHCLLKVLIWLTKWIDKYKMRSRVIGQIHDCLVASVHPAELQDFINMAHYLMTTRLAKEWNWINIPLEVECDVAPVDCSWADEQQWIKTDGMWALKV